MPPENSTSQLIIIDEFYLDLQSDGKTIARLNQEEIEKGPFPGLRPFRTSEFTLFKGRDGQIREVLEKLEKENFLAIIGSSGTGKSSLVRAGVIPHLFGGFLKRASLKWKIAICRPGNDPVNNLAVSFANLKCNSRDRNEIIAAYQEIYPLLIKSTYGILNAAKILGLGEGQLNQNLLIIVDQFEELFRYDQKNSQKGDVVNHFVKCLLTAASHKASNIYVIITMRSEFLGDTVKFKNLPEAINAGQYLVPQLNEDELREVIEGPILRAKKDIDPGLSQLLINVIQENLPGEENLDYLPLLQHALMCTYEYAINYQRRPLITIEDYNTTGQLKLALSKHAEGVFISLSEKAQDDIPLMLVAGSQKQQDIECEDWFTRKHKIAKILFQSLTDASTDLKGGRRPTEMEDLYAIAAAELLNATEEEVDAVVNSFREEKTSFIMPSRNVPLSPKLKLDISHESLMRNWPRLRKWMADEVKFAKLYKTLNERREFHDLGKDNWLKAGLLEDLVAWSERFPHSATWAGRYHSTDASGEELKKINEVIYKTNLAYLKESVARENEEKQLELDRLNALEKAKLAEKEVRLSKRTIRVMIASFTIVIITIFISYVKQVLLSNVAFSIAAIGKIDSVPNKEMAIKILIEAYNNFVDRSKDALVDTGLVDARLKINSLFYQNNFAATGPFTDSLFQPINYSIIDYDRKILVGYTKRPPKRPVANFQPNGTKVITQGNAGPAFYSGPQQVETVLYDDKGGEVKRWPGEIYPVENSEWFAKVSSRQLQILGKKSTVHTIKLNSPHSALQSIKYYKSKDREDRILVNWSDDAVEVFDTARTLRLFSVEVKKKPGASNGYASPTKISGQFLNDGSILIVKSASTAFYNMPYIKNFIQIVPNKSSYQAKAISYNDVGTLFISPSKQTFIALKEDKIKIWQGLKLVDAPDTIRNKRVKFDAEGDFLVYNDLCFRYYDSKGHPDALPVKLLRANQILDFQSRKVVAGSVNWGYISPDSVSTIDIYDLETHNTTAFAEKYLKNCFLDLTQNIVMTQSAAGVNQNVFFLTLHSLKPSRQQPRPLRFGLNLLSCVVLDPNRSRPAVTDFYGDSGYFYSEANGNVITPNNSFLKPLNLKLFNMNRLPALFGDSTESIISYFNKTDPTTNDDYRQIADYLHINNSWIISSSARVINLFKIKESKNK